MAQRNHPGFHGGQHGPQAVSPQRAVQAIHQATGIYRIQCPGRIRDQHTGCTYIALQCATHPRLKRVDTELERLPLARHCGGVQLI